MSGWALRAESAVDGVLRAACHRGRRVVVKLGGSAMEEASATRGCLRSVAALNALGVRLVLVHGGGKPIDRAMTEAGLTPRKVAGRRYTDDATLEIVVRVLRDEINASLVQSLGEWGAKAVACCHLLEATRLTLPGPDGEVDLGRVGQVSRVDLSTLERLLANAEIPVIPSLGRAADTGWLNINADTAASAVAGAINADQAIFLTDTPGVLRDRNDPASRIAQLPESECRRLVDSGVIEGGMVPKVEACFEALAAGAQSALIIDGREPYALWQLFTSDVIPGTEITRG